MRTVPNDNRIRLAHKAVMKSHRYQYTPALTALNQPRPRILIADTVGLGKTLEAGILATELMQRGRGRRILVVTLKSMLTQFQQEWWCRFSIPLVRLDSVGLARVRSRIPANHNPFNYYDKTIISMDTLKNNLEYRNYLETAYWDIIVIDECHNVALRAHDQSSSLRARLARQLAGRSDALILLSATPHDGSAKSFASLINLLDKTVIADPDNYTQEDFSKKGLVIRRFKSDVKDEIKADFQERITTPLDTPASAREEDAYENLLAIPFTQSGARVPGKGAELQRIGMQKALFSSPAAAIESVNNRIQRLEGAKAKTAAVAAELNALTQFLESLEAIGKQNFSKYRLLLNKLTSPSFAWSARTADDRLVIFSERIETLNWLQSNLIADLKLKPAQVVVLHGGMADTDQQDIVKRFGQLEDPVRVLLCSDVAAEGLNLHYFCHRVIHFDMPWSLMTYLQRNGRVDRFGQKKRPEILYLQTLSRNERIRGDQRILQILQKKDEQANINLGDPLAFLNLYDSEREEEKVSDFMAQHRDAAAVDQILDNTAEAAAIADDDIVGRFLAAMQGAAQPAAPAGLAPAASHADEPVEARSLFPDFYTYAASALEMFERAGRSISWGKDDSAQMLTITPPPDLNRRMRQIPREVPSERYLLCANPARVSRAMDEAREQKGEGETWPEIQYLWPQNPVSAWISDLVLSEYRGHRAPVISSGQLAPGEAGYVLAGLIPNRKGQPIIVDWQVVVGTPQNSFHLEEFDAFAERAGLKFNKLPNREMQIADSLQANLPRAIEAMRQHMIARRDLYQEEVRPKLAEALADLQTLQASQLNQLILELDVEASLESAARRRAEERRKEIDKAFEDYRGWIHDTMETEPQPFIQVVAVVQGHRGA